MATKLSNCTVTRGKDTIAEAQSISLHGGPSGLLIGEVVVPADGPLPQAHEILVLTRPGKQPARARVLQILALESPAQVSIGFEVVHLPPDVQGKVPPAAQEPRDASGT